jgi:hypothetical protein
MNTRFVVFAATLVALAMGSQVAHAQYPMNPYPGMYPGVNPGMYQASMANVAPSTGHLDDEIVTDKGEGKCGAGCEDPCCKVAFYGDFLYLRARDAEVAYGVEIDDTNTPPSPVQVGPVALVDLDFQPAFRAGARLYTDACNAVSAQYTFFDGSTSSSLARTGNNVLQSIVQHPGVQNVGANWTQGQAQYDINFDIIDASYESLFWCDPCTEVRYLIGFRYVQHEQEFDSLFQGNGWEAVSTEVDFYGAGARFGLEADRQLTHCWAIYARGYGSLIPGEFSADYHLGQNADPVIVNTSWQAGRIVTIWDLELGTSLVSKCGWYRFDVGYVFSAWTNMVQTDEWIYGVQRNNFIDMDSTSTLDGLVARVEVRY